MKAAESDDYDFSYNFVAKYKPIKIQIHTDPIGYGSNLEVSDISYDNLILACSKSINHLNYLCSMESLISSKSPIIKSQVVEHYQKSSLYSSYDALRNSLISNTTLKKFIFDQSCKIFHMESYDLAPLFEILKLNKSLTALGLNYFIIKDHAKFSPLIECKNITTLYTNERNLE